MVGISVFLVHGNHDAASRMEHTMRWPANVHVFAADRATTQCLESLGVAVHGQSYQRASETNDLAKNFPTKVDGFFNIGLLHTSLTGFEGHENYAPTSVETLLSHQYDYWALGHVHQRTIVNTNNNVNVSANTRMSAVPLICFSGNIQGRHIRETNEKGVFLVTVQSGKIVEHEFRAVDCMRWGVLEIPMQPDENETELLEKLEMAFDRLSQEACGRLVAVRVCVTGMTPLHEKTTQPQSLEHLIAGIRMAAQRSRYSVWVEKVAFQTQSVVNLNEIRNSDGLQGELLRLTDAWLANIDANTNISKELTRLLDDWFEPFEKWLKGRSKSLPQDDQGCPMPNLRDPDLRRQWLAESQQILINALLTEQENDR